MLIDIFLLLFLAYGFWRGFTRGLIVSIFSVLAWFIGLLAALKFSSSGAIWMRQHWGMKSDYTPLISFFIIMILVGLIVFFMGKALEKIVQVAQLGWINKTCGAILKVGIFFLIYCTLIWLMNRGGMISPETKAQSKTFGLIENVAPNFFDFLGKQIPVCKGLLQDISAYYNQIRFPEIFR